MSRTGGEKRRRSIVEEAIRCFGRDGYNATSLDTVAKAVGVRKQTLLYYFPNKDALLEACLTAAGATVGEAITVALEQKQTPETKAEAVVHAVFELAKEFPEFPMFVREASRLGPDAFDRFSKVLEPMRERAVAFLEAGMDEGNIRKQDPAMLLFTLYTAVIGYLTEASVLNAVVGPGKSRASLRRREKEVVSFVRAALAPPAA
ncbi:MAG: TetR/AcrR family transcriptional regulator [Actinomycetota bacterium]